MKNIELVHFLVKIKKKRTQLVGLVQGGAIKKVD